MTEHEILSDEYAMKSDEDHVFINPPEEYWNPNENVKRGYPRHFCRVNGYAMPRFRKTAEGYRRREEWLARHR